MFKRSCIVCAMKSLCVAANAWKAWTEMRRASMNASGDIWVDGCSGVSGNV